MSKKGPLAGIKVVDLTSVVMGPYCTQVMADMGADVVKVEPPTGDTMRFVSEGQAPGLSGVFSNVNRGKRSVVLDLRQEEDKAVLKKLIEGADVFVHSMRAKAIEKLGFSYEQVCQLNSSIVYVNGYGYSRRGPSADKPAYDDTIQGECGLAAAQQKLTGEVSFVGTIMADKVTGLTMLYATMMALFHRERTGEGQEVEVAMFETMASFMLVEHVDRMLFNPPLGPANYHRVVAPNRKPYKTKDGYIAALVYNDKHWSLFMEAVKPAWESTEFATLAQRSQQINTVYGLLGETFLQRTTAEWLELLQELGIPASPINSLEDLFEDPHLNAIGFFEEMELEEGNVRFPGIPTWFSASPGAIRSGAPHLGQHTEEIKAELGF
ncbi:CaiB/BaiF CoA transferase family protein [Pseudomaricurvus sp.]|uniref:CaiB/BaiF CoA transferase family protein n=1 Tax=Pseudomaricurvus sp. TaxID=2004510 RepID=UPI003F6D4DAC